MFAQNADIPACMICNAIFSKEIGACQKRQAPKKYYLNLSYNIDLIKLVVYLTQTEILSVLRQFVPTKISNSPASSV